MPENNVNLVVAQPTTKEQLISAGIGVAFAVAATGLTLGMMAAFGAIAEKHEERKLAKELKKEEITK